MVGVPIIFRFEALPAILQADTTGEVSLGKLSHCVSGTEVTRVEAPSHFHVLSFSPSVSHTWISQLCDL